MSGGFESSSGQAPSDGHSHNVSEGDTIASNIPLQDLHHRGGTQNEPLLSTPDSDETQDRLGRWRLILGNKFSRYWVWELLASAFSMICIATIVIVLMYEDGKRLDRWALMISPNAVVSFIAALAKSTCMLVLAEIIGQLRWTHFAHRAHKLSDLQV